DDAIEKPDLAKLLGRQDLLGAHDAGEDGGSSEDGDKKHRAENEGTSRMREARRGINALRARDLDVARARSHGCRPSGARRRVSLSFASSPFFLSSSFVSGGAGSTNAKSSFPGSPRTGGSGRIRARSTIGGGERDGGSSGCQPSAKRKGFRVGALFVSNLAKRGRAIAGLVWRSVVSGTRMFGRGSRKPATAVHAVTRKISATGRRTTRSRFSRMDYLLRRMREPEGGSA